MLCMYVLFRCIILKVVLNLNYLTLYLTHFIIAESIIEYVGKSNIFIVVIMINDNNCYYYLFKFKSFYTHIKQNLNVMACLG